MKKPKVELRMESWVAVGHQQYPVVIVETDGEVVATVPGVVRVPVREFSLWREVVRERVALRAGRSAGSE
jgi:hypothetical protein